MSFQSRIRTLLLAGSVVASMLILPASQARAGVFISVGFAPPALPLYVQPPLPAPGFIWTPGYWAYANADYYWVPGTWVQPPEVNVLWTPPYWGWAEGAYLFHEGYWGPHVGFYGGVNYGYGYGGSGYEGGRWDGGNFSYNRSVNNFGSVSVQHAYEQNVSGGNRTNVSYAGGAGGVRAEPTAAERSAASERHVPVTAEQSRHVSAAAANPAFAASHNNGHPAVAATSRPAAFEGTGAARAEPATAAGRAASPAGVARPGEAAARPAAGASTVQHAVARPATAPTAQHAVARPATAQAAPHQVAAHAAQRPAAAARPAVQHVTARPAAARPAAARAAPAPRPAAARAAPAPRPAVAHAAPAREQHAEKR